jgi:hypothetical protein
VGREGAKGRAPARAGAGGETEARAAVWHLAALRARPPRLRGRLLRGEIGLNGTLGTVEGQAEIPAWGSGVRGPQGQGCRRGVSTPPKSLKIWGDEGGKLLSSSWVLGNPAPAQGIAGNEGETEALQRIPVFRVTRAEWLGQGLRYLWSGSQVKPASFSSRRGARFPVPGHIRAWPSLDSVQLDLPEPWMGVPRVW